MLRASPPPLLVWKNPRVSTLALLLQLVFLGFSEGTVWCRPTSHLIKARNCSRYYFVRSAAPQRIPALGGCMESARERAIQGSRPRGPSSVEVCSQGTLWGMLVLGRPTGRPFRCALFG
eukprot:8244892-Pyramimonas_sp.AAC.1